MLTFRTVLRRSEGCRDKRLRIYEAENGSLLSGPFELHSDWILSVAWSPDGQRYVSVVHSPVHFTSWIQPTYRIVTGSKDTKVKVVVAETGQVIYDMALHDGWVNAVLYTTEYFISGSSDR